MRRFWMEKGSARLEFRRLNSCRLLSAFEKRAGAQKIRLEIQGFGTEAISLVAAALQADVFSDVVAHEGMASLGAAGSGQVSKCTGAVLP